MHYTSYYGNLKNLPQTIGLVNIARNPPQACQIVNAPEVYPSALLLNMYKSGQLSVIQYVEQYTRETLSQINYTELINRLQRETGCSELCFVCYEKDGFCHRHLFAESLRANGIECIEWTT